jgi:uncharacterized LabA/DUF88 family protein
MKRIILIDGENFVHALLGVLRQINPSSSRESIANYPIRKLLASAIQLDEQDEVYYFGTKLKLASVPAELKERVERTRALQAQWANHLQAERITFIKAGYLRARETEACAQCGRREAILLEKGVDVALAVKAVETANPDTEIVFITSDTDLLPAMRSARALGAQVTYVGFEENIIIALAATATRTRSFTRENIVGLKQETNHG